jgi:hypothetical protein
VTIQNPDLGIPALPYARRQRIVPVDDEALELDVAQEEEEQHGPRGWLRARSDRENGATDPHRHTLLAVEQLRRDGYAVMPVSLSEAAELRLPAGHPLDGQVYVGDPVRTDTYYLLADFHQRVFEAKFADAVNLLAQLGATRFEVRSEYGWDRKTAADLKLPLQVGPVTGKASLRSKVSRSIMFKAELEPSDPRTPVGVAWLPHERLWQNLVEMRLSKRLTKFDLVVEARDDYQITAEIAKKVAKVNLGVGGSYAALRETKWVISGEFDGGQGRRRR